MISIETHIREQMKYIRLEALGNYSSVRIYTTYDHLSSSISPYPQINISNRMNQHKLRQIIKSFLGISLFHHDTLF